MKQMGALRIIDVNLNRLREALRVCEEITRFVIEDTALTSRLKETRHEITAALRKIPKFNYASLVLSRDSENDIGRESTTKELNRKGIADILRANLQRAKEAVRVLEEFLKLIDRKGSLKFKKIRFKVYEIERLLIERL